MCTVINRLAAIVGLMTILFFTPTDIQAQSCPHGYMPLGGGQAGWSGCAPMNAPNQAAPDPGPEWASRWGAIAADSTTMTVSSVSGMSSKRKAEKAATKKCRSSGGSKACKVWLSYGNQCGVFVAGQSFATTYTGGSLEDATKEALRECGEKTDACNVLASACSYPQRLR